MHLEISLDDIYAHDNWAGLVEYRDRSQYAREDRKKLGLLFLLLSNDRHMLGEGVEKMVDNIRSEDFNALLVCVRLCLLVDFNVEAKHGGILLVLLEHGTAVHDISLVDWSNSYVRHRNL